MNDHWLKQFSSNFSIDEHSFTMFMCDSYGLVIMEESVQFLYVSTVTCSVVKWVSSKLNGIKPVIFY